MDRIDNIKPTDSVAYSEAKARWDSIAKPLGSFGELELAVQKLAAIQGTAEVDISKRTAVIFCGDHGVVAEGVTQCGSEVTAVCAKDIAEGRSNINAVASTHDIEVIAVDMGIANDVSSDSLINKKTAYGTENITRGPAMTLAQAKKAIAAGIDLAGELKAQGAGLLIAGEMGIGNTTCAAAIAAVLLDLPVEHVTGRGAGLSTEGLDRKILAVKRAIEVNDPDADKPLQLMQKLGGYELAGMMGLFLGGAFYRIPVVVDGVVSAAAAACAFKMNPLCAEYMLASHCSDEPAAAGLLAMMRLRPVINAGLRLGEGTGGALLVPLLEGALAIYKGAHRFDETTIERYAELK